VTLLYADTSALARAYLADEPEHELLRGMLLEGSDEVVTSALTRIELASAVRAAAGTGRLRRWQRLLDRIDADCDEDGPVTLLALQPDVVLEPAYDLVRRHRLRTLDAIHLAVALEDCPRLAADGDVAFVTRDAEQAAAARSLGLALR
jgi:predicted nucleic acid-binding protein